MDNDLHRELLHQGTAQEDVMRAFEEAEERRRQGQPYTKDDFLPGPESR